ncbi:MAG: class I SAM-dependent methyltransferase, partial [FCB group bacterium]|nr:class I SAM-dependent methyltransferase [FCB group bacterium]
MYSRGRHLNLYPYHAVVGFVLRHYGQARDRSLVRILELGFGAGNNLWFAAREGFSVAGIEGAPTAVAFAQTRFHSEGLTGDLREGNVADLPWEQESFDLVLDRGSLCTTTLPVFESALAESRRVLKVGGRLLSVNYSHQHPGRTFGAPLGGGDYDAFTGGYFHGLGTVHFCDRAGIDAL